MKSRILVDLLWIVLLYAVYGSSMYIATVPDYQVLEEMEIYAPIEGGIAMDREEFYEQVTTQALSIVLVSLLAALAWYVVGEWGPKPHAINSSTWRLIWLIGLVLVIAGAFLTAVWEWPTPSMNSGLLLAIYLGSGMFFYYAATMLFSPVPVKYVVPGSQLFRRW